MRQLWLLPDVLHFLLSCCVRLTLLPTFTWMGSSLWRGHTLGPYSCVRGGIPPRTPFGSNRAQQGWARRCSGPYSLLGHGWALCGSPSPVVDFGEFHPYNSPSKFRLLLSCPRRKGGILTFIGSFTVGPYFTRVELCFSRASLMTEVVDDPCGANYCF